MNELLRRLLNLPEQASTFAREVDGLHYAVISTTMLGAFGVFTAAILFLILWRRRSEKLELTPRVLAPLWFEVLGIVGLLSLFLLFWHVGFRQYLRMTRPPADAIEVYVTGKQWMWKFAYPEGPASAGVLYVPVGRPVKLLLTSRDVIHSFFVPAFRVKRDAVPGRYTVAWFEATMTGTFPIRCAEFCGEQHSMMLADVVVLEPEVFEAWLRAPTVATLPRPAQPAAWLERSGTESFPPQEVEGLAERGLRTAAQKGCLACHSLDGTPHIGPSWKGLFGRRQTFADGSSATANEAYLTESMMDPLAKIVAGYAAVMPTYQGRLEAAETASLVELIKSLASQETDLARPGRPSGGEAP